jgi:hypothetical protein
LIADPTVIVCAYTLSNASVDAKKLDVKLKETLMENIPSDKRRFSSYPATLIGRLAVSEAFRQQGIIDY